MLKILFFIFLIPFSLFAKPYQTPSEKILQHGEKIYIEKTCLNCHGAGNMGAPSPENKKTCKQYFKKQTESAFLKQVDHVWEGLGVMPQQGGCYECTDEDIAAAVHYMWMLWSKTCSYKASQ